MRDVVTIVLAALFGIAVMGAFALASVLPTLWTRRRPRMPARKGGWLVLTAVLAFVFAWGAFGRLHAALALWLAFVAWALGGSCLAVAAPWLIWRTRWLRIQ